MGLSCLLRTTCYAPQEKLPRESYNSKFFIDQACLVKMAGYWPYAFFCNFMDLDSVLVYKQVKKELSRHLDLMLGE